MTKSKILPENEGSYICVICFNSTSKKKIFKCKNKNVLMVLFVIIA